LSAKLKFCPRCERNLPANAVWFYRHPETVDNLQIPCKSCCAKRRKLHRLEDLRSRFRERVLKALS